ncbi:hypothetical protein NDU88_011166 [Pleurodeles waltl]|uniref:Uncharacterized protein n=1 Tax=Pleurodeles waltl TaxID=8319 RepID=A0AAV7QZL8_PLEWA|nr:hypothetical protein NDU88_011166 [Pleurodeles waltl]
MNGTSPIPDNAALLVAITQFRDMLNAKIGAVGLDVTLLRQDLWKVVERITEAETSLSIRRRGLIQDPTAKG